jgi:predicted ATPase
MGELARPITPLVGRDRELRELAGLVGTQRLVTVLGPTRLAIAVAQQRRPRYVVDLTDAASPEPEIAAVLEINSGTVEAVALIAEQLADRAALLVLDNCEHLVAATAELLPRLLELLAEDSGDRCDRPARHQSLRTTIEWSYRLLSPSQQRLFQRLAVFAGTFDLEAAENVGGATPAQLGALLDRSFLTVERQPTGTRYRMLETLRQFAEPVGHRRHAEYFRDRAERIDASRMATGCDAGIARLVPDAANYRAALGWSIEHEPETALRLRRSTANRRQPRNLAQCRSDPAGRRRPSRDVPRGRLLLRAGTGGRRSHVRLCRLPRRPTPRTSSR